LYGNYAGAYAITIDYCPNDPNPTGESAALDKGIASRTVFPQNAGWGPGSCTGCIKFGVYKQANCPAEYKWYNSSKKRCESPYNPCKDELIITLSGSSRATPWNPRYDEKHVLEESNIPFKAVVKDQNGQPKANIDVIITADVKSGTGGHDNDHNSPRPKGRLVKASTVGTVFGKETLQGQTDGNGIFAFTFGSEEASGTHTLNATCQGCTEKAKEIDIYVLVDRYLEPIPPSNRYTVIDTDGTVIGSNNKHKNNHYLTPEAAAILVKLSNRYFIEFTYLQKPPKGQKLIPPLPLHLNDASLALGGKFDVFGDWTGNDHVEHRKGTVIDIRANSKFGAIPPENFKKFIKFAGDNGALAKIHSGGKDNPNQHFHVQLLGRSE
jgi:hypothetical protein